jgi:thioesterase domain-containing protein
VKPKLAVSSSVVPQPLIDSTANRHSKELESLTDISSNVLNGVIECFAAVLGGSISSYSAASDFFALGGDSLSAAQFAATLNAKFALDSLSAERQIQTRTFLICKSVLKIARLIGTLLNRSVDRNEINPTSMQSVEDVSHLLAKSLTKSGMPLFHDSLYVLQVGCLDSSLLPLVLVHAANGDVSQYQALTVHLHNDQLVMAFRAPSLDGITKPHASVVDMVKDYLATLMDDKSPFMYYYRYYCDKHPNATSVPFLLGGHSFGGLGAYEMACQLSTIATKCIIPAILLLDSPAPGKKINDKISDDADLLDYFVHYSTNTTVHRPIADELRDRCAREGIDIVLLAKSYIPPTFHEELSHALPTLRTAMRIYSSQISADTLNAIYSGSIIFFRPEKVGSHPDSVHRALYLDWLSVLNNSKVTFVLEHVPGDHVTMMQAVYVAEIGKIVRKWCEILSK